MRLEGTGVAANSPGGRVHLGVRTYSLLQAFVHRGHRPTFERLRTLLGAPDGATVVELGCGAGAVGRHFVRKGYDYWGVDPDPERISAARAAAPKGTFIVGDVTALESGGPATFAYAFIHGVLHHLDDERVRDVLARLLAVEERVVAISEPFRPVSALRHPFWAILASADEGAYVRTARQWLDLFDPYLDSVHYRSLAPRWPVRFIDVRLLGRRPKPNANAGPFPTRSDR